MRNIQRGTYVPNLKDLSSFLRLWMQKWIWPTFGCKVVQGDLIVLKLNFYVSCHIPKVYPSFKLIYQSKVWKLRWMDRQRDGRRNIIIFYRRSLDTFYDIIQPFFQGAYKNYGTKLPIHALTMMVFFINHHWIYGMGEQLRHMMNYHISLFIYALV